MCFSEPHFFPDYFLKENQGVSLQFFVWDSRGLELHSQIRSIEAWTCDLELSQSPFGRNRLLGSKQSLSFKVLICFQVPC